MDADTHILLSGALTFGVPLLFAVRELVVLRRGGGGSWRGDPAPEPPPPPPSRGTGPLPDCLIPRPLPRPAARPRVLEDA